MLKRISAFLLTLSLGLGIAGTASAADNPFTDVSSGQYYYNAVLWAYETGITTGIDATHFAPKGFCTRGQVVTFLWRAMGEPKPSSRKNPFVDVMAADYFYDAVLWAVENGITNGTDANYFSPQNECTQAQVVTFLWRTLGKPTASAAGTIAASYRDGEYYKTAVAWGDRKGMFDHCAKFVVDDRASRGDVVYYLFRCVAAGKRTVPDLMAYLGANSFTTTRYDDYYVCEATFNTVSDSNFSIVQGFWDIIESHGYQLELADETKQQNSNGDRWYRWYQYVGPDADGVGVTSAGTHYNFCVLYSNTKGYDDPASNRCSIKVCVGTGLTQVDTGERVKKSLTAFVPAATPTPTPTPKPAVTPTPTPKPTAKPNTGTTDNTKYYTEPYKVPSDCTTCDGLGYKLKTCWRCNGTGRQPGWGDTCSLCGGINGSSPGKVREVCKTCGGDGKISEAEGGGKWIIPPGWVGRCMFCDGTGKYKHTCDNGIVKRYDAVSKKMVEEKCTFIWCNNGWITCPGCNGDGRIDVDDPHDKQ